MAWTAAPWLDRPIDKVRDRKFYCYTLMDPRKPGPFAFGGFIFPFEPFYIGKGEGYRLHAHFTEAKRYKKEGVIGKDTEYAKLNKMVEIMDSGINEKVFKALGAMKLVENLNEFESFEWETVLITAVGRIARRMGTLVNENDGTQFTGGYQKVSIPGFTGMNNMATSGDLISDNKNPLVTPHIVLNADIGLNGEATKRQGFRLLVNLPGARSLWSCAHGMFVMAPDNDPVPTSSAFIYKIVGDRAIKVTRIADTVYSNVFAVDAGDYILFTTEKDLIFYNPLDGTVEDDRIPVPVAPLLDPESGVGTLPKGRYFVCSTKSRDGLDGAPGPSAVVDIPADGYGINIINDLDMGTLWMTEANGDTFFRCSETHTITKLPGVEPLQTYGCYPLFPMTHTAIAAGRLFGVVGNKLWYSEPYRYDLIRPGNFFEFHENITMVAPSFGTAPGCIFVGLETKTVFLSGASFKEMSEKFSGPNPVFGSLAYCQNMPELGNNIPVWVSKDGMIFGRADGTTLNATLNKIRINPGLKGASYFRMYKGSPQIVSSFTRRPGGLDVGFGDSATCDVIRNGKVL